MALGIRILVPENHRSQSNLAVQYDPKMAAQNQGHTLDGDTFVVLGIDKGRG